MGTQGTCLACCPFQVVRNDDCQEQTKTVWLSCIADGPEHFTITQGGTTTIRRQGEKVQASAFIPRKRCRAKSSGNGEHEAVYQDVRDGRRMGNGNGKLGYACRSRLHLDASLINLSDAEIPYDLRPMFRSLTSKPVFAPSKFSCVSQFIR